MKKIILLISLFFSLNIQAEKFKVRAREHYEVHTLKINNQEARYKGLAPSLNFWWEEPYKISYGFMTNFGLGKFTLKDDQGITSLNSFNLYELGAEAKYFLAKILFVRGGLGLSYLDSDSYGLYGVHFYGGLGVEIPFKHFGLALEAAYQYSVLESGASDMAFVPSIGFHFYDIF